MFCVGFKVEYSLRFVLILFFSLSMDISFDKTRVGLVPYTSDILVSGMLELQESTSQERVLQAVRDLTQGDLPTG